MSERVKEIRARLERIEKLPGPFNGALLTDTAPDDIRYLLDRVEALEEALWEVCTSYWTSSQPPDPNVDDAVLDAKALLTETEPTP